MSDDKTAAHEASADELPVVIPAMEAMLTRLVCKIVESRDRSGGDRREDSLTRRMDALAPHKEGHDISKYIEKLEDDLKGLGCPHARWKMVLFQKLQSKSASGIAASVDRDRTSYDQLKALLIRALGTSLTTLGTKLTTEFASTTHTMSLQDSYLHHKAFIDSILMQCNTVDDLALFFARATYRASRPPTQRSMMDQWTINRLMLEPDKSSSGNSHSRQYRGSLSSSSNSTYECFKCHKLSHRAFECRSNVTNPGARAPPIDGSRFVEGFVNGAKCEIVPDTGAEITIVPGSLVYDDQLCEETVQVRGWDSNPVTLNTAVVDFRIDGKSFQCKVAVALAD